MRPFGASDGAPAFLRPAARRGCEPSCSARASSSTTASVSVIVSGVLSPVMRGVDAVVADVGPVAAVLDHDRAAFVRVLSQRLAGIGAEAASLLRIGLLLGDQGDGAVEADGEHVVAVFQTRVGLAVFDVGPEAADAARIGSPSSGDMPTSRGSASRPSAFSRSMSSGATPFGTLARFGFSTSCFCSPFLASAA